MSRTSGITGRTNNGIFLIQNGLLFKKIADFRNQKIFGCDIHQICCDIRSSSNCDIQKEESVWKSVWQQKNI